MVGGEFFCRWLGGKILMGVKDTKKAAVIAAFFVSGVTHQSYRT